MPKDQPLRVVISYSREDAEHRDSLVKTLKPLEHEGLISIWLDQEIIPADEWLKTVEREIKRADLFLILVSPDALASKVVYEEELALALDRRDRGTLDIIPIILRASDWRPKLGHLQSIPAEGRSIVELGDPGWLEVATGIRRWVENFNEQRPIPIEKHRPTVHFLAALGAGAAIWTALLAWLRFGSSTAHGLGAGAFTIVPFGVVVLVTVAVHLDARALRRRGVPIQVAKWTILHLVLLLAPLPLYFYFRSFVWRVCR